MRIREACEKTIVEFNLFFEAVVSPAMGLEALAYATTKKMVGGGEFGNWFYVQGRGYTCGVALLHVHLIQ
jgi:hypothetical protein